MDSGDIHGNIANGMYNVIDDDAEIEIYKPKVQEFQSKRKKLNQNKSKLTNI